MRFGKPCKKTESHFKFPRANAASWRSRTMHVWQSLWETRRQRMQAIQKSFNDRQPWTSIYKTGDCTVLTLRQLPERSHTKKYVLATLRPPIERPYWNLRSSMSCISAHMRSGLPHRTKNYGQRLDHANHLERFEAGFYSCQSMWSEHRRKPFPDYIDSFSGTFVFSDDPQ